MNGFVRKTLVCIAGLSALAAAFAQAQEIAGDGLRIHYHEALDIDPVAAQALDADAELLPEDGTLALTFDAFGETFELNLAPNRRLLANLPRRAKQRLAETLTLYRGELAGVPGSWVRLARQGNRLSGMIWDGAEMYVVDSSDDVAEALVDAPVDPAPYPIIYRLSDAVWDDATCGLSANAKPLNDYRGLVNDLRIALPAAGASMELDVAVVADAQFVSSNGNPQAAAAARMNVVDGIFSEQLDVQINVVEIRALSSNGSLSSSDASTLLRQFANFTNSPGFNNPGLAHLFTGRDIAGSTIGIAFLSVLCDADAGVGVSQVTGSGTAGALTVAHEMGHNFGAPHDNQGGSACASTPGNFLMNPRLNGSDTFSACSRTQMQPNINRAACITDIPIGEQSDMRVTVPVNPFRIRLDRNFNYEVDVRNSGPGTASDVGVTVPLPSAVAFLGATVAGGSCARAGNGPVRCTLADLPSGVDRTIRLRLRGGSIPRHITSSIRVAAANDPNTGNNTVRAVMHLNPAPSAPLRAHFDTSGSGFRYVDDAFRGTSQPAFASGTRRESIGGFAGGYLRVALGGRDNQVIDNMSGGWRRSFTLASAQALRASFRYRLAQTPDYENDEISEGLLAVNGTLVGRLGGNDFLDRVAGDGNGGPTRAAGWRSVRINLGTLPAGTHVLALGAFNNRKTFNNESTVFHFDDIVVEPAP